MQLMNQKIQVIFDRTEPLRLDKYLVELKIQELYSRTFIERLVNEDRILVNKIPIKKSYLVNSGDIIDIKLPDPEPLDIIPQDIPLDVLFEDDDLAVINKQPGLIVHPGFGNPDQTLVNAIVYHFGSNLSSGREINRPGIVHRLDRGTSGLMIIAKNDPMQALLSEMFAHRQIKKSYLAITSGIPEPAEDRIETYLSRDPSNPRKMRVSDEGKWALTSYKIIKYFHYFAVVDINLETGRMHQIRVHFAHRNYPILGDLLYNSRRYVQSLVPDNMKKKVHDYLRDNLLMQALHSWRLQFTHPLSGKMLDIRAMPSEPFMNTLAWLDTFFGIDNEDSSVKLLRDIIENGELNER